jgi:DNA modification methylase
MIMSEKKVVLVKCEKIEFCKEYYPRENSNIEKIEEYRLCLDELPPIEINKSYKLVDGFHRLAAHKQENVEKIKCYIIDVSDEDILEYSIRANATHGFSLTRREKRKMHFHFYKKYRMHKINESKRKKKEQYLADMLGLSLKTIERYGDRVDDERKRRIKERKAEKEQERIERDKKIVAEIKSGKTQEVVAEEFEISQQRVAQITSDGQLSRTSRNVEKETEEETTEPSADEQLKEKVDPFNVWYFTQPSKDYSGKHPLGGVDPKIVEQIIYYFTEENDLVVDIMAGQGFTRQVCEKYNRKSLMYDIKPINIYVGKHDALEVFPDEVQGCDHIYWDPPYYNLKVKDAYANPKKFYAFIEAVGKNVKEALKIGGKVSFVMCNMNKGNEPEWLVPNCYNIFIKLGFKCVGWIQAPLPPQNNPYMGAAIVKAKERKKMLGRDRVVMVFEKIK